MGTPDETPVPTDWIGRRETRADAIDPGHVAQVAATLGDAPPTAGAALPYLWHWAFFADATPAAALGNDGHPARGGFLPPAPGRRRMWAGGRIRFLHPLRVGAPARRVSTVARVVDKPGRTGALLFVTVKHAYTQRDELCITEEQDIVYRTPSPPRLTGIESPPVPEWIETVHPDPVLLFRCSAVTFNAHRIHYDVPYVRDTEGYPNLVVHGPLIATLMLRCFTRANPACAVAKLAYRGLRPLIAPRPFQVAGRRLAGGRAFLWAAQGQSLAHRAEVEFGAAP